jgi:hypothetical protein
MAASLVQQNTLWATIGSQFVLIRTGSRSCCCISCPLLLLQLSETDKTNLRPDRTWSSNLYHKHKQAFGKITRNVGNDWRMGRGMGAGGRQQSDKAYVILKLETLTELFHKTRPTAFRNARVTKVRATTWHAASSVTWLFALLCIVM